jgi:hypothetical protein
MSGEFNRAARTVIVAAQWHARRLGHHYVGCEHLLLAAAASEEPAGTVLRARGLGPDRVEELIVARAGLGAGPGLFADLDSDALAAVGIDVEEVRVHVAAQFTPEALARADRAVHCLSRPPGRVPLRRRAVARLLRPWHRRRPRRTTGSPAIEPPVIPAEVRGRYQASGPPPPGYIPFTPGAKQTLERSHREAAACHDVNVGAEHIVLALTTASSGALPAILSDAGTTAPALRTAILESYRPAC